MFTQNAIGIERSITSSALIVAGLTWILWLLNIVIFFGYIFSLWTSYEACPIQIIKIWESFTNFITNPNIQNHAYDALRTIIWVETSAFSTSWRTNLTCLTKIYIILIWCWKINVSKLIYWTNWNTNTVIHVKVYSTLNKIK